MMALMIGLIISAIFFVIVLVLYCFVPRKIEMVRYSASRDLDRLYRRHHHEVSVLLGAIDLEDRREMLGVIEDVKRGFKLDDHTAKRLVWRVKQEMLGEVEGDGESFLSKFHFLWDDLIWRNGIIGLVGAILFWIYVGYEHKHYSTGDFGMYSLFAFWGAIIVMFLMKLKTGDYYGGNNDDDYYGYNDRFFDFDDWD